MIIEIMNKINNKEYDPQVPYANGGTYRKNHILNKNKSKVWNKEAVVKLNLKMYQDYQKSTLAGKKAFERDVKNMISKRFKINDDVLLRQIYNSAWEENFLEGWQSILEGILSFLEEKYSVAN